MGVQIIGITNNLNFTLNTNRLIIMTKKKTSQLLRAKNALVLPAIAMLLFAFSEPNYKAKYAQNESPVSAIQKGKKNLLSNDWSPGKQGGKAVPIKYLLSVEFK